VIDFSTTPEQRALAEAGSALLQGATDRGGPDAGDATWTALAEFGALGLLTESGDGSLSDLVALFGALGAGLCPGSVLASAAAGAVLDGDEAALLADGRLRVSVAVGGYVPWLSSADLVLEIEGDAVWRVEAQADDRPAPAISGEAWTAVRTRRIERLDAGAEFVLAAELGLAAALLGMAHTLLDRGAAHARTREQFGRPIGGFQGVAHPLADAWARVTAADELVRLVAAEWSQAGTAVPPRTDRARLARAQASAAALQTAYVVHQAMGGLSFAVETGIGAISTRIRQWSLLLPDQLSASEAER
jgi:Acyl-CoA dehydrogenase, C-terminal domain